MSDLDACAWTMQGTDIRKGDCENQNKCYVSEKSGILDSTILS